MGNLCRAIEQTASAEKDSDTFLVIEGQACVAAWRRIGRLSAGYDKKYRKDEQKHSFRRDDTHP
jgi:hypothetical protein